MSKKIKRNWGEADIPSQKNKTILITGANSGLGFEAARMLAGKDAHVLMACRDESRGIEARDAILAIHPAAHLDIVPLDLADMNSVAEVPGLLTKNGIAQIDVLLNNAGIMMPPKRKTTKQGFELQFGVNHLAHFALTRALFPLLARDARIVTVASIADRRGDINWDDLQWTKDYHPAKAYGQSKTANLLFTLALTKRLHDARLGITAVAAHPGVAMTNLVTESIYGSWMWLIRPLISLGLGPKVHSPASGALPEVYAATGEIEPGAYYGPSQRTRGYPIRAEAHRAAHSNDAGSAERLWTISEELTGGAFDIA